ncbi:E3 ubiquitin-protein ligase CCNB1IP1 [Orobanche minor]
MRCNACWRDHMKPVDISPNDEWVNMAMAGISPQILMKSAYRSVTFYIGQKDLEMQFKMNKIVGQCRQKCEAMQEKFTEKLEQVYTAYQKMTRRSQMMEQEIGSLLKDKQELQEKVAEKCRQKRKLDEMYDLARTELESLKRSAIQPANHCFDRQDRDLFSNPHTRMDNRQVPNLFSNPLTRMDNRQDPDLFSNPPSRMDNRDTTRKDWSVFTPDTPGPGEDIWPARQNSDSTFELNDAGIRDVKQSAVPFDTGNRGPHSSFGVGSGVGAGNPSMTLRNLILSPMKRPQLSRSRPKLFTL